MGPESQKQRQIAEGAASPEASLASILSGRQDGEAALLQRAYEFAQHAHAGQRRASGEPYISHSLEVARILADLRLDHETIAAALLHDVVEDTAFSVDMIAEHFGDAVAKLVDGVTKMDVIRELPAGGAAGKRERAHSESLRKMLLAMAEDVRVVLIKLADRLHNMRTLDPLPAEARRRIAQETLELFAPLANRLGIWQIKWELEDLAFRQLEPGAYEEIVQRLAERRIDREQYIARFVEVLKDELGRGGIKAEVKGRAKHTYGIWRKMRRKNQDFHQIHDLRAVRVLVDTVPDCYAALGVVHTRWQFIRGEFDDYIATPKENNYRSIHTAVIGPAGKTVEVQIRTYEMQGEAELGVAAHWRYKEKARQDDGFDKKLAWLRQLLEWKDEVAEASEFIDQFKSEVFADRIYVFTPKGNIVDLPQGATPLDFAYHIHTEVGHRCRGAKVNGQMVPLTYALKTGAQVSILTVKKGEPSRDWLNQDLGYLKTSRARSKVQHWFRQQNLDESIAAGRITLERELNRLGLVDVNYEKLTRQLGFSKVEELLAAVGRGETRTAAIVGALREVIEPKAPEDSLAPAHPARAKETSTAVEIQGVGNLLTRMAKCCKPLPGDGIIGFITSGRGVTVHRRDCPNALRYGDSDNDRLVEVNWGQQRGNTYPVEVEVMVYDRQGLLRDIAAILANEKINILAINTLSDRKVSTGRIRLTVEIPDVATLSRVLAGIDRLPNVTAVRRIVQ